MGTFLKPLFLFSLFILNPSINLVPSLHAMMEETDEKNSTKILLNEKIINENPIKDEGSFPRFVHAHKKYLAPTNEDIIVTTQRPAVVLALDGGGMRGLTSAEILWRIENNLCEKLGTKVSLADSFDLFAGTSTGGLISLMLASGHSIDKCVDLYKSRGSDIFKTSYYNDVKNVWGYWGPRYDVDTGLDPLLDQIIGKTLLKESKKPVFVTTFAYEQNRLLLLDSEHAKKSEKGYHNITMKEAARATSAAPTYFKEATLKGTEVVTDNDFIELFPSLRVIDGGVAANDPAQLALSRAHELFPGRPVFLISIGTGEEPIPQMNKNSGLFGFAPYAINVFSNGATSAVEKGLKMELHENYCRLQFKCDFALDDTRPETIKVLEKDAYDLSLTPEFDRLMNRLVDISKMGMK